MAEPDVRLLFGVLGDGSIAEGTSGGEIKKRLDEIIRNINRNPLKVKVTLDTESGGRRSWSSQLQTKLNEISTNGKFAIQVSKLSIGNSAITDFKKQMNAVLKTLNLDKGTTITLSAEGIGEIKRQMEQAGESADAAARKTAEFRVQIEALGRQKAAVQKTLAALDKSSETEAERSRLAELAMRYEQWAVKIETIRAAKVAASVDAQAALVAEGEAIRANILAVQESIEEERAAATGANAAGQERMATLNEVISAYKRLNEYINKNPRIVGTGEYTQLTSMRDELAGIIARAQEAGDNIASISKKDLRGMLNQLSIMDASLAEAGRKGKTLGGIIESAYKKFGGWMLVTRSMMAVIHKVRDMVINVRELDAAMTEIRKVTNETEAAYDKFFDNASNRAKRLGATFVDTISATADFARLGYSLNEAADLADAALVYKNVGDGIKDVGDASASVISTMKAFDIEASNAMTIVDKFNEVGNNFAISSAGIGDALLRSASALAAANNTLDESIALVTAANNVIQDPDKVGTALKTVSMFLRAAKTEAEEAGESTDGMATSISELREELSMLTNGKVDIQIDDDTFKSTYQILKEISQVWDELTDVTQANILEKLGGKRNSNVVMALLTNFQTAEDVLQTAENSAGSALAENEKYLDSINGKIARFQTAFEDLSSAVFDSGFVKGVVDFGTSVIEGLTFITEKLGSLPTLIGAITAAITMYSGAKNGGNSFGLFGLVNGGIGFDPSGIRSTFSEFNKLVGQSEDIQTAFIKKIEAGDSTMAGYLNTVKGGNATLAGYKAYCKQAGVETSALGTSSKAAAIGVTALNTAMNMLISMGITFVIQGIVSWISHLVNAADESIERTKELNEAFQEFKSTNSDNISTLQSLKGEFDTLSKGVSRYGENVALTSDEYDRYKEIVQKIVDISPALSEGYSIENGHLADKNELIERAIQLQEQQYQQELRQMTTTDKLIQGIEGYVATYDKLQDGKILTANTDLSNGIWQLFRVNDRDVTPDFNGNFGDEKSIYLSEQILKALGVTDIGSEIEKYTNDYGYYQWGDFWDDYAEKVTQNVGKIAASIDYTEAGFESLADFENAIERTQDAAKQYTGARDELEQANRDVANQLKLVAEGNEVYANLSTEAQGIVSHFIDQFGVEDVSKTNWWGTLVPDEDAITNVKVKINNFIQSLTPEIQNAISSMFDLKGLYDAGEIGVNEFKTAVDTILNDLEAAGFDGELIKYLSLSLETDMVEKQLNAVREAIEGVKGEYDEALGKMTSQEIKYAYKIVAEEGSLTFDELLDKIAMAANEAIKSEASIKKASEKALETTKLILSGISEAQMVLSGQQTGKSIGIDDFNSNELKDYTSALEYHNGVLQLNAEKVSEIIEAKTEETIATNSANKAIAQSRYLDNAAQIEKLRKKLKDKNYEEGESDRTIQANIDALLEQNGVLKTQCDSYDLMSASLCEATDAYHNWINAQNASQSGDMFDDTLDAINRINETLNDSDSDYFGRIGRTDYKSALSLIIPESIDSEDAEKINSYLNSIYDMFTYDKDGNRAGLNIENFCQKAIEKGLMVIDEASDSYVIAGQKTMEDFAEGLNLSLPMVQAMFGEMEEFGGKFYWDDEANKTIGDLAVSANVAAENLRALNQDMTIGLDVSGLDTINEKADALDATIEQMQSHKARVGIDPSEVEYANSIIAYCVIQKQQLENPAILEIDASKVAEISGAAAEAIGLLQAFKTEYNNLQLQQSLGLDTTDAKSKVESLRQQIESSDNDYIISLGLDVTSVENLNSSILGIDIEAVKVAFNIDDTALISYQPENKQAMVVYDIDTTKVDLYSPPNLSRTVTYYVKTDGALGALLSVGTEGLRVSSGGSAGTIQVNGTAHAGGNWGTAFGGRTLVGELGREIVVDSRTSRWYTVGDHGAEFVNIPKGAIVFNHRQTEDLLKHGYVAGRASALVNGIAMVTGGIGRNPAHNSSSSGGNSTSNYGKSKPKSTSSSTQKEEEPEIFDWIEVAIERIERAIDRLKTAAESTYKTLKTKLGATYDEISTVNKELSIQQQAYIRYMQQAASVGLSSDLAAKVQNGTIDISEYDGDTAEKIKDYQKWYEKALQCSDAVLKLKESLAALYENKFDDLANDYENQLSLLEHLTNSYNNGIDRLEERGYLASTKYYEALRTVEQQNIDVRKKELTDLTRAMSEAINSGVIQEGSEAWYDFQTQINQVKEAIQESETEMIAFANSIREIKWEHFDYLQEQISNITEEAGFLIDLMENSSHYTDNGQLTDTGMATMGLHGQNYNVYMAQADKYAEELVRLSKEIAEDPNNTKLLERREELLESQRDAILAAEDEKQAIVNMVREGIELELDALQNLIDKYTESLDSAKDLYDYQKKIKSQTSEISSLQKQLTAYAGDTSEENRATMQKLQVDLSEAMENLEETQYDHYISDQKKLLDNLYDEYELVLNERLDNIDALLSDMIDSINANSSSICDTLLTEAEKAGYTITESEKAIWSNEGAAFSIIAKYGESFLTQMTSVNDVISRIALKIGAMVDGSDNAADTAIQGTDSATKADPNVKPQTPVSSSNSATNSANNAAGKLSEDVKRGVAAAIWIYGSKSGWGNDPERRKKLTAKFGSANASAIQSYINAHANNGDLYQYWVNSGKSNLSQYYYSAFKKGGLADYTGMAWLDGTPTEPEMVLNPEDTANFIALKDAMRSIADGNGPLAGLFTGKGGQANILEQLAKLESPLMGNGTNVGDITYQINIPINHVQDYNDFVNQLRKDGKFEKMIQSMTVDRLVGGAKLAKNKYRW